MFAEISQDIWLYCYKCDKQTYTNNTIGIVQWTNAWVYTFLKDKTVREKKWSMFTSWIGMWASQCVDHFKETGLAKPSVQNIQRYKPARRIPGCLPSIHPPQDVCAQHRPDSPTWRRAAFRIQKQPIYLSQPHVSLGMWVDSSLQEGWCCLSVWQTYEEGKGGNRCGEVCIHMMPLGAPGFD